MSGRCRVLIADDNDRARLGLRALLALRPEIEVVGEAADGEEVVQWVRDGQPDVVLMDPAMPGMGGAAAIHALHERWPHIQVIALITFQEIDLAREAVEAGAICCFLKNVSADELAEAIRAAYASPLGPPLAMAAPWTDITSDSRR